MVSKYFDSIVRMSLFQGLEKDFLQDLLSDARVESLEKEAIIFTQEDQALSFKMVLSGSIRLFTSDEEGCETTLQIITSGNFINDVFCNNFQISAQTLKDSEILSIPLNQVQECLEINIAFSSNLTKEISLRNQDLIEQLTRTKSLDSKQKLGRFLLENAFDGGSTKNKESQIECSKSVIASYLGINPETFSRALKKLKDDGEIVVEKDVVTLVRDDSLCGYCDSKINEKCDHKVSDFCMKDDI